LKILVTGGFGYLGGRVAQSLVGQGYKVVLGSRREQSVPDWLSEAEVVRTDWDNLSSLKNICKNINVVIHTAGMNAQDCALDPVGAIEFNGVATTKLVQATVAVGVKKFIYLSTAHVYASPLVGEIDEESCLTNKHPYATSHVAGENAVLYQSNISDNFTGIVLRLSNGIGAPSHKYANCWMLAVNDFCRQVVENGKIMVNSPREVERDFVPISLICEIINSFVSQKKTESCVINVSSSTTTSLQEMTDMIRGRAKLILGFEPEVVFKCKEELDKAPKLSISNIKLKEIVVSENNTEEEIDRLLITCNKWLS
jgi:UDP-glucose 4-epimerase